MATETSTTTVSASAAPMPMAYVPASRNEVIKVIALGVVAGLVVPLLSMLLANYFIEPVFCHGGDNFNICANGGVVANHIAAVIVAFAAFAVLTHWAVYRALLLMIASTVAMWGFKKYADPLTSGSWIEYYLFSALLYALAFALFYWLLRIRNFVISIVVVLVAVVAICWAMVA